jgi:DNA-binding transcriptional MerR regulator
MGTQAARTVSEVARLAGVTVRTLHHYDEIGLLHPSGRSDSGYRLYRSADLERLHEILFWRELGFALGEIRELVDGPGHDRGAALRRQRTLLDGRAARLRDVIGAVENAIAAHEGGLPMTEEEMFEVFGDFDPTQYEEEVEERWSGPLLDESRRRALRYRKEDWQAIKNEGEAIARDFASLFAAGEAAGGAAAMNVAERHRSHIDRWFYPVSYDVHTGLGEMYVADPRFTAYWEKYASGLAVYVREAIAANAARETEP